MDPSTPNNSAPERLLSSTSAIRWYERQEDVYNMVEALTLLPPEYQSLFATVTLAMADRVRYGRQRRNWQQPLSIGVEKHLGLLKSQAKRRDYDRNPVLFKAINGFYLLEAHEQVFLAQKLNRAIENFEAYLEECAAREADVSTRELTGLIKASFRDDLLENEENLVTTGILRIQARAKRGKPQRDGSLIIPAALVPPSMELTPSGGLVESNKSLKIRSELSLSREQQAS